MSMLCCCCFCQMGNFGMAVKPVLCRGVCFFTKIITGSQHRNVSLAVNLLQHNIPCSFYLVLVFWNLLPTTFYSVTSSFCKYVLEMKEHCIRDKNGLFQGNSGNFFHWYLCRIRYTVCVKFEYVMKSTKK